MKAAFVHGSRTSAGCFVKTKKLLKVVWVRPLEAKSGGALVKGMGAPPFFVNFGYLKYGLKLSNKFVAILSRKPFDSGRQKSVMSESKSKSPTKGRIFLNRAFSSFWAWALVVVAVTFNNPWLYLGMFGLMVLVGLQEFFKLVPDQGFRRFRWQTFLVSIGYGVLLFATLWGGERWAVQADGLAIAALAILIAVDRIRFGLDGYRMIDEIAMTMFGFVYVVILFGFVPKILHLPLVSTGGENSARFYIVFLLVVTKFTDMGAYLVGSVIGKHKMVPKISPGKTWEGFAGALFFAVLGSLGCFYLFAKQIPLISLSHTIVLAVVLALVAVVGDLVESILKRSFAAKDSGSMMPGIGGVLDLIDSILLTGPVFFVYLLYQLG
jgi:phosphatidate cytidylyltransferase